MRKILAIALGLAFSLCLALWVIYRQKTFEYNLIVNSDHYEHVRDLEAFTGSVVLALKIEEKLRDRIAIEDLEEFSSRQDGEMKVLSAIYSQRSIHRIEDSSHLTIALEGNDEQVLQAIAVSTIEALEEYNEALRPVSMGIPTMLDFQPVDADNQITRP